MNKQTRKELAEAQELIQKAISIIEKVKDGEQDKFDNLPEGLQESERGQKFEETVSNLEEIVDFLNEANDGITTAAE